MKNVIFDLDGTLALCDHRRHHVETEPKNWGAFFAECDKDTVNEPIARLFRFYRNSPLHRVWILSGRRGTEETERKTLEWLYVNNLRPNFLESVEVDSPMGPYTEMRGMCFQMRKHGDYTERNNYAKAAGIDVVEHFYSVPEPTTPKHPA